MVQVVEERWGSLGELAVSAASHRPAPSRAHLHAIKNRQRGSTEDCQADAEDQKGRDTHKVTATVGFLSLSIVLQFGLKYFNILL